MFGESLPAPPLASLAGSEGSDYVAFVEDFLGPVVEDRADDLLLLAAACVSDTGEHLVSACADFGAQVALGGAHAARSGVG